MIDVFQYTASTSYIVHTYTAWRDRAKKKGWLEKLHEEERGRRDGVQCGGAGGMAGVAWFGE